MIRFNTQRLGAFACAIAVAATGLASADQSPEIEALWKDPTFQKQFVGAYGVNADIEPRIMPEEVKTLEKIRPLMAEGKLAEAEAALRKALKGDYTATFDFTLAGLLFQQDRIPEALDAYKKAVDKFPSFRRAWRNIGLIHARNGEFDDAIRGFTRMIELGGGDAYSFGLLGFAYASKQDYQAAEVAYRNALLLQPDNTEWRLGLTRCVFRQEKYQDASALLDVLIERTPDKAEFWLLQAQAFLGMKQPLRAAQNLEAMDMLGKSTLDSLHTLGDIYVTENLTELAVGAYERAIAADPKQPIARPMRAAEVLASRGAITQARRITTLLREGYGSELADADRGKLLKLEARLSMADGASSGDSVAVLEEMIKLDPLDGEALMLLGQHYAREREPEKAIFYYERAAGIEAFAVNARIRHAQVLVGQLKYEEAIPLLRQAQEARPREDVARYLEQLERVAKSRR